MSAYSANSEESANEQNSEKVSTVVTTMFQEQRERTRNVRRNEWLAAIVKRHEEE